MRATGSDADPARRQLAERVGSAHTVTVRVVVDRFRLGGRDYHCRDELEVPAEHVEAWLTSGRVRLVEQLTATASEARDVHDLAAEFSGNGR